MITIYLKQNNRILRNPDPKIFEELGYDDILWIDLFDPDIREQKQVEEFMELNLQSEAQVEEIETSSRYFETESAVYSNTNFPVITDEGATTMPVSFVVSEGVLITVRDNESRTFADAAKRLQNNYKAYSTGYHLLITILEIRIDADADLAEGLAKNITFVSKEISSAEKVSKEIIQRISILQEDTMSIREMIFDRQRILSGILKSEHFPSDIYPRLQLMIRDVNSILSHADFSLERLDFLRETAVGMINLELTQTTKIFTMASVFFMPATLIASLYGMNFKIMPELDWTFGYPFAIGLILLVSWLTYVFFKRKKWL